MTRSKYASKEEAKEARKLKMRDYNKAHYWKNRDQILEDQRDKQKTAERRAYNNERNKAWQKANPERHKEMSRSSSLKTKNNSVPSNSPESRIYYGTKRTAKRRGLEFNLDLEDIIIPTHCPITELPIIVGSLVADKGAENWENREFGPALDRIDNTKGYVKDNVRVISYRGNRIKAALDIKTCERIIKYINGEI